MTSYDTDELKNKRNEKKRKSAMAMSQFREKYMAFHLARNTFIHERLINF